MPGRTAISRSAALLVLLALCARDSAASRLHEVVVYQEASGASVKIGCEGSFEYDTYTLQSPERFVVDLFGVTKTFAAAVVAGNVYPVGQVRLAQLRSGDTPTARLIVDLEAPASATVERLPEGILLRFSGEPAKIDAIEIRVERQALSAALSVSPVEQLAEEGPSPAPETVSTAPPDVETEPETPDTSEPEAPENEPREVELAETNLAENDPPREFESLGLDPIPQLVDIPVSTALEIEPTTESPPQEIEPDSRAVAVPEPTTPEIETIEPAGPALETIPSSVAVSPRVPARGRPDALAGESLQEYSKRRRGIAAPPTHQLGRYSVLIFESSDRAEADRWRRKLAQSGERAFLNIVLESDGGPSFRVLLGRFEDRAEAVGAAERAKIVHGVRAVVLEDRRPM